MWELSKSWVASLVMSPPPRRLYQTLEEVPLKPSLEQLAPKAAQHGRVEARLFESEIESVFPSEVEAHLLLGLQVRAVVVVFEEHGEHDHRGRYARSAPGRILVERSVVLIFDKDIPPFGEPSIERVSGDHLRPRLRVRGRQVA